MDPPSSIVKSFKYSSKQQPMFGVVELEPPPPPPLHYRSSTTTSTTKTFQIQDASFSSYLKSNDPNLLRENHDHDTEISIFDAQKYFSDSSDHKHPPPPQPHDMQSPSVSSVDGYARNFRTRSFHATPTASSEASWNSQTGLLANPPGAVGVSLGNFTSDDRRRSSAARKWMFGRKCCCSGKKSVRVKEATLTTSDSEHGGPVIGATENNNNSNSVKAMYAKRDSNYKSSQLKQSPPSISSSSQRSNSIEVMAPTNSFPSPDPPRQQRISASGVAGGFSFPILNTTINQTTKPRPPPPALKGMITKPSIIMNNINPLEDPPRDSLEVFQPMREVLAPPVSNVDDDVVSDASSDLFEIESFSTQTTSYPMYRRRDSLDEAPTFNVRRFAAANGINFNNNNNNNSSSIHHYGRRRDLDETPTPSVAGTECYAPSEVSIDWSVTTAEGFDKASVSNFSVSASEIGSTALYRQRVQEEAMGKKKGMNGGGLLLMSCRQEKAVSVGPQPVKCEGGATAGGRPPRANKPAMGTDHSARLSLAFAA